MQARGRRGSRGAGRRRINAGHLPPGCEPDPAHPRRSGAVRHRSAPALDALVWTGIVAGRIALVRRSALPLAFEAPNDRYRCRNEARHRGVGRMNRRSETQSGDVAALVVIAAAAGAVLLVWLWGGLAGLLFGRGWPPSSAGSAMLTALDLPAHLGTPAAAWPRPVAGAPERGRVLPCGRAGARRLRGTRRGRALGS